MSKNFELLRRAGKEDVLFGPSSGNSQPENGTRSRSAIGKAGEEAVKSEEEDLLWRGPDLSGLVQEKAINEAKAENAATPQSGSPNGQDSGGLRDSGDGSSLDGLQEPAREQITKLIRRLFPVLGGARSAVFSGVERNTGCTWLIAHAAQILSGQRRGSICLVDANLRFPALHDIFAVSNHHGLTDAVLGSAPVANFVQRLPAPNLWLLTCGSSEKNEDALLATEPLLARVAQLRKAFDLVLIDSPPLNLYNDAITLGSACDGIALVLKANSSRRETAHKVLQEVKAANVRLLGAVLNRRTFPVPAAIYSRL